MFFKALPPSNRSKHTYSKGRQVFCSLWSLWNHGRGVYCHVSHTVPFFPAPLEYSEGEPLFYIVSPRDVVVAKERDQDDHIDWLLEKKKYEVVLIFLS